MFKNTHVQPSKANGVGKKGNPAPLAHTPANNVGMFPVKLGAGQHSQFGQGVNGKAAQKGAEQSAGPRANTPANNTTSKAVPLGTTKHSVGSVPHYLRNPNNSGKV